MSARPMPSRRFDEVIADAGTASPADPGARRQSPPTPGCIAQYPPTGRCWQEYEKAKQALPPMEPAEYDAAIAAIVARMGL